MNFPNFNIYSLINKYSVHKIGEKVKWGIYYGRMKKWKLEGVYKSGTLTPLIFSFHFVYIFFKLVPKLKQNIIENKKWLDVLMIFYFLKNK